MFRHFQWMFRSPDISKCILCDASNKLSGEHKIKASALRSEFGTAALSIGYSGENSNLRYAQSAKSKKLHFTSRLCEKCNNERTQSGDLAFDRLHLETRKLYDSGTELVSIFDQPEFGEGSIVREHVFRYFAKLLACQMADAGAPTQIEICDFAIGKSDFNPINLNIRIDSTYSRVSAKYPDFQYAAHGGLNVWGNKYSFSPTAFYSTLSIGPIQYCYHAV